MKKLIKSVNVFVLFFLALVFTVAACSTTSKTGLERSQEVQSTMQTVDNDIKSIIVQIDAIQASLDELTEPNQADLKKAFDLFSKNASKIEAMEDEFVEHAAEMEESGEAYFSEWDSDKQNYDNPEIQRKSEERREELGETYDKIAQNNTGVKEAFRTYVSDINEIERFLSNDLTSEGMDAISRIAYNVMENGADLKNELQNLQDAIEETRIKMRQS